MRLEQGGWGESNVQRWTAWRPVQGGVKTAGPRNNIHGGNSVCGGRRMTGVKITAQ